MQGLHTAIGIVFICVTMLLAISDVCWYAEARIRQLILVGKIVFGSVLVVFAIASMYSSSDSVWGEMVASGVELATIFIGTMTVAEYIKQYREESLASGTHTGKKG